jgi:hypothetical protein
MKLSEMQKILKEYEDEYGDIEIQATNLSEDPIFSVHEIKPEDFSVIDELTPEEIIYYIDLSI